MMGMGCRLAPCPPKLSLEASHRFFGPCLQCVQPQISTLLCSCRGGNCEHHPQPPAAADAASHPHAHLPLALSAMARDHSPRSCQASAPGRLVWEDGDFFGRVCQVGSNQREGERERLLTTERSHLSSSVIGACSRQGADTEVILVFGLHHIAAAKPLGRGRQGEVGKQHNAKMKSGRNHVPALTVNITTELLPIFTGETFQISTFQTNISAFPISTEVTIF